MRYLITFSYNGSYFNGYQRQNNKKSVQKEIETVLSSLSGKSVSIYASSRTDALVHAVNQKAHFDFDKKINPINIKNHLNKNLNGEIFVKDIKLVSDDFHARYNSKYKKYKYYINIGSFNTFLKDYEFEYNKKLNLLKMRRSCKYLIGCHDFRAFVKNPKEKANCIRTIKKIKIKKHGSIIEITFLGTGFLRHMIRNIIGVLIEIGSLNKEESFMKEVLDSKNKTINIKTVPGNGLYLWNVYY